MEIKLDAIVSPELKEYLLSQEGITDVNINYNDYFIKLNIKFNEKTTPVIIMKYIELFEKYKYSNLVEFDKENIKKFKTLKYTVDDMCCEYCYMDLIMNLFKNNKVKSAKSNFVFDKPTFDVEFLIEYSDDYDEAELIEYIKSKI